MEYFGEVPEGVYFDEDRDPDPEATLAALRKALQERRYRRILRDLPPERSRAELRKSCGVSQEELAGRLGVKQSRISKLERAPDLRLSLLRAYIEALGGTLHLHARFPGRDVRVIP